MQISKIILKNPKKQVVYRKQNKEILRKTKQGNTENRRKYSKIHSLIENEKKNIGNYKT